MARPDFVNPDFVQDSDPEILQERMMENLPPDISDMPGDFPYDFTMPTALEISKLIQFNLVRGIMIAFPEYAWDDWLDQHGSQVHVTRHEAMQASGNIVVKGDQGLVIDVGTVFCVPATDTQAAIEYATTERAELTEGEATIPILAVEPGIASNVPADTIIIMASPVRGVTSVTNPEPVTGGTEIEDDESYYERIHAEYEGAQSYVGNDSDYIRWAREVPGVGDCVVVPTWDGPGTVKLLILDSAGNPANEQLQKAVYDHIVSPDDRSKRLLPAGDAMLTVEAATTTGITYTCTGMELSGTSIEEVTEAFRKAVAGLYPSAKEEGELKYNDVRPLLADIPGIEDFEHFHINGGYANIVFGPGEYPATASIEFTEKEA